MRKLLITAACILSSGCLTSRPPAKNVYVYTQRNKLYLNGRVFEGSKKEIFKHIPCVCGDGGDTVCNQPSEPWNIVVLTAYEDTVFGLGIYLENRNQTWQRIIFKNFLDTTEKVPHIIKIERPSDSNILLLFGNNEEELYRIDSLTHTWHFYDGSPIIDTKEVKN